MLAPLLEEKTLDLGGQSLKCRATDRGFRRGPSALHRLSLGPLGSWVPQDSGHTVGASAEVPVTPDVEHWAPEVPAGGTRPLLPLGLEWTCPQGTCLCPCLAVLRKINQLSPWAR